MTHTRTRKNTNTITMKNLSMNSDVYALRSLVMVHIYSAKGLLRTVGVDMPRIEIRITESDTENPSVLARASMGGYVVWVCKDTVTQRTDKYLREVVYHEICHALWATPHIDSCPLMSPMHEPMTHKDLERIFLSYAPR